MGAASKIFNLRNFTILFLLLGIFILVTYKFLEYQTLQQLRNLHSNIVKKELSLIEQSDKLDIEISKLFDDYLNPDIDDAEAALKLDEMIKKMNLAISNNNNYISTLEKNRQRYKSLLSYSRLALGERGKFIKEFLELQDKYYDDEISVARENSVATQLLINIFNVGKDKILISDYTEKAFGIDNPDYYGLFSSVAPLEKYTRSDYKFQDEDKIKEYYPYGYDSLIKNRNYLGSYYSVAKDLAAGDIESANYKISKVVEDELALNVDFERIFEVYDTRTRNKATRILETLLKKIDLTKDFEEGKLSSYPFVEPLNKWTEDVELCQLYAYKTSLYSNIVGKYPEDKNFNELLETLKQLSPQTTELDRRFDKSSIVYTNDEEMITFRCKEHLSGEEYLFQSLK